MVRSMPAGVDDLRAAPLAIGLFISVCALVALCAKHHRTRPAKQVVSNSNEVKPMETKMMMTPPRSPLRVGRKAVPYEPWDEPELKFAPRSPLASPKALLATVSNKALPMFHAKKTAEQKAKVGAGAPSDDEEADGVWKRTILMGERCQPPDFSGVIYYDERGQRLPKFPPKSPRGSSPLANFTFPVVVTRESSS